jgi:hypothetical protein
MALVRCEKHGRPMGRTRDYVASVRPVGYPRTSAVCGTLECREPGLIWLEAKEKTAYDAGERIFRVPTHAVQVQAE